MGWEVRLFVITWLIVAYTWAGYPALLWVLKRVHARGIRRANCEPNVSIIVAVHNEENLIAAKLHDCLALQYPRDYLEILVASDGSTDATEAIVQEFATRDPRVRLIRSEGRVGKSGAQNLAAHQAKSEILLFTDADTRWCANLLKPIAENFADPRVGLVAAVVHFGEPEDAVSKGQGSYWTYELFLRQLESDIGILATASGAAFAVRRSLFRPMVPRYGDDCVIPLDVRLQGFRVVQESSALVFDQMPHTTEGELRTRTRMTMRNWTGTLNYRQLLNPLRFPGTAWGLVSHKLLRWLTPFFLAELFLVNTLLAVQGHLVIFWTIQAIFYVSAMVGWRLSRVQKSESVFGYPFAFCLANIGFFLGIVMSLRRKRVVAYK